MFHNDSYGYRPGRSAHQALTVARERCWRYVWVLDLDIKGFFDNIDHELLMRAVRRHTDCKWVLLYIERWLKAPVSMPDGTLVSRDRGTPQGPVMSSVLANLFLHYAFGRWMQDPHPDIPCERYADDVICHCTSESQARSLRHALEARFRAILPISVRRCTSHIGSLPCALGAAKVQTTQRAHDARVELVKRAARPPTQFIRPLAHCVSGWTIGAG